MTKILNSGNPFVFRAVIYFMKVRLVFFFRIVGRMAEYLVEPHQIPHLLIFHEISRVFPILFRLPFTNSVDIRKGLKNKFPRNINISYPLGTELFYSTLVYIILP